MKACCRRWRRRPSPSPCLWSNQRTDIAAAMRRRPSDAGYTVVALKRPPFGNTCAPLAAEAKSLTEAPRNVAEAPASAGSAKGSARGAGEDHTPFLT